MIKYSCEIVINLPRAHVADLFDNPENLLKWQDGLQKMEHLSGTAGEKGAKTRLMYDQGGHTVEMTETILEWNMPEGFSSLYETAGAKNWLHNQFHEANLGQTRWVADNPFEFSGEMAAMNEADEAMVESFRQETLKNMTLFKQFAENTAV